MLDLQPILDKLGISFEPLSHTYKRKRTVVASVNQIIDTVMGNSFTTNSLYMIRARDKGTLIHKVFSDFILFNKEPNFPMIEFDNFLKLSNEHNLTWNLSEQIIYNKIKGVEYCGTLDLYSSLSEEISDIKTGSSKNIKKWTIQLSLYAQALRDTFGLKVSKGSILWLHNEKAEYIPIELLETKEIVDFLKDYRRSNINNQKEEKVLKKQKSKRSEKC